MEPSLGTEFRDQLRRYLSGDLSLAEFEDWFVPRTWNIHQVGDPGLADLAYEIDLRLAEYSNGHRTENDLKEVLGAALWTIRAHLGAAPQRTGS